MYANRIQASSGTHGRRSTASGATQLPAMRGAWRRVSAALAAVTAALVLCACSGMKGLLPGEHADTANQVAAAPSAGIKRTRMTSRDILLEWGTLAGDRPPFRNKRMAPPSPLDTLNEPAYVLTIPQIMANAACRSCDERPYHAMVVNASLRHGVPASLIHAVIQKESGYNPAVTSRRRARG